MHLILYSTSACHLCEIAEQMIETLSPNFNRFETETTGSLDDGEKRDAAEAVEQSYARDVTDEFIEPVSTGAAVIDLLFRMNAESRTTLVLVTHDLGEVTRTATRAVVLGGLIVSTVFTLVLVPTLFSLMMDAKAALDRSSAAYCCLPFCF